MSWSTGFGKAEFTAWEHEISMMGWGRMDNRIVGAETPIYARAAAFRSGGTTVVYVCLDLMAVSLRIRRQVIEAVQEKHPELHESNIIITATHTHSGPSGYSEYFFINLNGPGFSPVVCQAAVDGSVEATLQALENLQPAELRVGTADMPLDKPVAFNRSWFAYNLNEDVEPVTEDERDSIVNRTMTMLVAYDANDMAVGCINWHPVHCTSVHAENDKIHSDNKGLAAANLEADFGGDFVALFVQESSGDVSPNYRYSKKRKKVIGHLDNDYESAEFNAKAQVELAKEAIKNATPIDNNEIFSAVHYVDFPNVEVSASYGRGAAQRTTVATLGLSMAEGTAEGPGPILGLKAFNRWMSRQKAKSKSTDDPKVPMIDAGNGLDAKFLGKLSVRKAQIPSLDASFKYIKTLIKEERMDERPWFPQILPLQLLQIGPILVFGIPFECTTIAGRRMRDHLLKLFPKQGIERVVMSSYCNAYAGYLTTFEEYQLQHYEAGYTLFGPHQLGAVLTMLDWMQPRIESMPRGNEPPEFPDEALMARKFDKPWPYKRARPVW